MPRPEVHARVVVWTGVAILLAAALVVAAVFALLHLWNVAPGADRTRLPAPVAIPGPVLQSAPQLDLARYREEKARAMDGAGWVDARAGIVRIPVADAMAVLAARAAQAPPSGARP